MIVFKSIPYIVATCILLGCVTSEQAVIDDCVNADACAYEYAKELSESGTALVVVVTEWGVQVDSVRNHRAHVLFSHGTEEMMMRAYYPSYPYNDKSRKGRETKKLECKVEDAAAIHIKISAVKGVRPCDFVSTDVGQISVTIWEYGVKSSYMYQEAELDYCTYANREKVYFDLVRYLRELVASCK